jgi:hypothetical protein
MGSSGVSGLDPGVFYRVKVRLDSSWPAGIYTPMLLRRVARPDFREPTLSAIP